MGAASTALAEGEALDVGLGVGIGVGVDVGADLGVGVGLGLGVVIVSLGESPLPFVVLGMHIRPCLTVPVGHCLVSGCMFILNLENTSCS